MPYVGGSYIVLSSSTRSDDLVVIGAGLWRTGTSSLKVALEELTSRPCLHMSDLMPGGPGRKPGRSVSRAPLWLRAVRGEQPYWPDLLRGYGSTTDWPALAFWRELADYYPEAKLLLSLRDAESWWQSISQTVLPIAPTPDTAQTDWDQLAAALFERDFIGTHPTKAAAIKFYDEHNAAVRRVIPSERLIEWHLGDGWQPLCEALGKPVPNLRFPHLNTRAEFRRAHQLLVSD